MSTLKVELENCYGIKKLECDFDFSDSNTYAIYASNGVMKSSFSRTFDDISAKRNPQEERFNRKASYSLKFNNKQLSSGDIYVLKSELDLNQENPSMTNILINPKFKTDYDKLISDIEKSKSQAFIELNKKSKVKKTEIEAKLLEDFDENDLFTCLEKILTLESVEEELSIFKYGEFFCEPDVLKIISDNNFIENSRKFHERYLELFNKENTIYKKGLFSPAKAKSSFEALQKKDFFKSGHRLHFEGDDNSINKKELDIRLEELHNDLENDIELNQLKEQLIDKVKAKASVISDLIEKLPQDQVELFLDSVKPENQTAFKRDLWTFYIQDSEYIKSCLEIYKEKKEEISKIEREAAKTNQLWSNVVDLFNERFIDMPFRLNIPNLKEVNLNNIPAKLNFIFQEGEHKIEKKFSELQTLSQGEKRAVYILNFIFEVEARKKNQQKTIFILDDIADSFDYKNKHAIIEYLNDLKNIKNFYQIILTHNFDFYRALNNSGIVNYKKCLIASKNSNEIQIQRMEGIKDYFNKALKSNAGKSKQNLCASIPFTRNILEYTKGEKDPDYLKPT